MPPLFLELDTPDGWVRLEIEATSEAGVTLASWPSLASIHALLLRPGDRPAILVIPNEAMQSQRRYEVRVRLVGSLDPGRPIELAFTTLTPALREHLRLSVAEPVHDEPVGGGAFAFALADAPPPRETLLPNGRRLLLPSSAPVYEQTRQRRAASVLLPHPVEAAAPEPPAASTPRLWLRAVVPALGLGIGVLGLALAVALGAALLF